MKNSVRSKILVILVIVLLVTNAAMLYYISACGKKEEFKPMARGEWVARELKLDSSQKKAFQGLREKRDSLLKNMQMELRTAKLNLISLAKQPTPSDSSVDAAIKEVTAKQYFIEKEYFEHYLRMRSTLNESQHPLLDSMLIKMVIRNTGGDAPPPSPKSN